MGTALITGASSGLGVDFARLFANDGHSVILVARRKEALEKVASELRQINSKIQVHVIDMDLGVPNADRELFKKVKAQNLSVDFLVNNAGFGNTGSFAELPLEREMQMIDLNIRTLVGLTHLFLPEMLHRKSGKILNIGSTAGFQPGPFMATYYASKAFVNSFSEALNEELKGTGVSCTVLAPGATATDFANASGNANSRLFKQGGVATSSVVAKTGYNAMMSGSAIVIAGFVNNVLVQSLRVSPRAIARKLAGFLNRPA